MSKILIIEDEPQLARFVQLELEHEEYETVISGDGREGLALAQEGGFDVILLDIMLPGLNGLEVLRRMRKSEMQTPVIMLTARDSVMDKVSGLDMGADDYITKPFAIEELLARIRAALRKRSMPESVPEDSPIITVGELELDTAKHTISCCGQLMDLTVKEFGLLQALMENAPSVMTREQLLERVWGYNYFGETNVVDVYIRYLRGKLEEYSKVKYVQTVRGVGYALKEPEAED
ncbi:MAG: response regulator transcription factor [Oscillospiraceae bacterium]|nr:response regulator transcription factor [Oscillospiraceae bacterium]